MKNSYEKEFKGENNLLTVIITTRFWFLLSYIVLCISGADYTCSYAVTRSADEIS